ncbi:thiol-disulfide oxidoreductase DCC family protein [Sagittula sp. SSi028]|uniref:thiol-disulfide oxidoreductase DCC family protein n=1 Tax=Sagittula sp. SSi028 TaxID=3400636 RepID=UPI003AF996FF
MHPKPQPLHSYRADPAVPTFDDGGVVVVLDGACALCSGFARWLAHRDPGRSVRFVPVATPLGQALLRHYGLDPEDPQSWLVLRGGRAFGALDAVVEVTRALHVARALRLLGVLPPACRDWIYARVARNRYVFGQGDICGLPDPQVRQRLIDADQQSV